MSNGKEPRSRLVLRCSNSLHPDIALSPSHAVVLGRGRETQVKDRRLSRRQLRLEIVEGNRVSVKNIGPNASEVAGRRLATGETVEAGPGDVIKLLEGQYPHEIVAMASEDKAAKVSPEKQSSTLVVQKADRHWSQGLLAAMQDPKNVLKDCGDCVIIEDKYPKARHHYLTLPKKNIPDIESLTRDDLPLLQHMRKTSADYINQKHKGVEFRQGYHAVPSMKQVHLHTISQDMLGEGLKKKHHWNSFTTKFFVPAEKLEARLEKDGKVERLPEDQKKELLGRDLRCHKCDYQPKNMPDLKKHLAKHL